MAQQCSQCGLCCSYITVGLDTPEDHEDYDEIVWFLLHENTMVYIEEEDGEDNWYIEFKTPCKALKEDNTCGNYENRPDVCREYDPEECDRHGEEESYKACWKNKDEFIAWMRENKIKYEPGK